MTHQDFEDGDIVDRYVGGLLDLAEREAFEEHFFACDACFAAVREAERVRGAVAKAVKAGVLRDEPGVAGAPAFRTWMPLAASVLLLAALGWTTLKEVPALRSELAQIREERDRLQARAAAAPESRATPAAPEANVPIAMLQAERGAVAEPQSVTVPETASHVILWMSAPASDAASLIVLSSPDSREISRINGLRRNSEGAYVASVPAASLTSGIYRLRLVTGTGAAPSLLGEYLLRVAAPR